MSNIFIEIEESFYFVYRLLGNNPYLIFPIKNTVHANIIIPIFSTIPGASAAVNAIAALRYKKISVTALQDYY